MTRSIGSPSRSLNSQAPPELLLDDVLDVLLVELLEELLDELLDEELLEELPVEPLDELLLPELVLVEPPLLVELLVEESA